jgi:integrase
MPSVKLSKKLVESHQLPASGVVFLWDAELRGFGISLQHTGVRSYVVRYRVRGSHRDRRMVIGRHGPLTLQQARQEAMRVLGEVAQGKDPAGERQSQAGAMDLKTLGEIYLVEYAKRRHKDEGREARRKLERDVYPSLGRARVEHVSLTDVERYHRRMTAEQGPIQANRTLALLSGLFKFAERRGYRPQGTNPCRYVPKNPETSRERFLTDEEIKAYLAGLDRTERSKPRAALTCNALRLLLYTGARKSEVLSLRWEHVDFQRAIAFLPDSKTGKRPLLLPEPALRILRRIKGMSLNSEWVFASNSSVGHRLEIRKTHIDACQLAGIRDLRVHDLRHSFASVAVAGGHGLPAIGKALGHRRAVTTERYSHLAENPVRHAVESTAAHIDGLAGGERDDGSE